MEFTQPLGVGLGLAVRINNQYSHPVQTLTRQSMIHGKYHGNTGYLFGNIDVGIQEFVGTGYRVDDGQMTQTDKLQMMTSRQSPTSQSHKQIAPMNCTKQDDIMSKNGNDERCFRMLQSNSGAYGGPETC